MIPGIPKTPLVIAVSGFKAKFVGRNIFKTNINKEPKAQFKNRRKTHFIGFKKSQQST